MVPFKCFRLFWRSCNNSATVRDSLEISFHTHNMRLLLPVSNMRAAVDRSHLNVALFLEGGGVLEGLMVCYIATHSSSPGAINPWNANKMGNVIRNRGGVQFLYAKDQ